MKAKKTKPSIIDSQTTEAGCGPLMIDVVVARKVGWDEELIRDVWEQVKDISIRASLKTHRKGPVSGCCCISCDLNVPLSALPEPYKTERARWIKKGLVT